MTKEELQICEDLLEVTSLTSLPLKIKYAEKHNLRLGINDRFLDEVHKHMIDAHIKFRNMVIQQAETHGKIQKDS
jgi:hypothetical protein